MIVLKIMHKVIFINLDDLDLFINDSNQANHIDHGKF
jgi:hypothetical protein